MSHLTHPAHTMPFDALVAGLKTARDNRHVYERRGPDGLVLYVYSEHCVYDGAWDAFTMAARGLILDSDAGRIVATPFPKFFNVGERGQPVPDMPFQVLEKLDGSLIIIFHHQGRWRATTKGAFDSWQAKWAEEFLNARDVSILKPGTTYLAEGVHPDNKIVVPYAEPALVLLAAYDASGVEVEQAELERLWTGQGLRLAKRYDFNSIAELVEHTKSLPRTEEGYVARFSNGLRLKFKGNEYKRIHALISRITPLAMWEIMAAGDDMQAIRRDIPEEFWFDFDSIVQLLQGLVDSRVNKVGTVAQEMAGLTDKDVGLKLNDLDPEVRPFIFLYRKNKGNLLSGRARDALFRSIRPTGNELAGYIASYAMARVKDDLG